MRPGAAFVPFAMVAVVLLAGCTGSTSGSPTVPSSGDPVSVVPTSSAPVTPDPTGSTSSPAPVSTAVPADVPTTGPNLLHKGERPPVMPVLATEHTAAGAVAFAKFFIRTIDWGFATTSGAYMRHYFAKSCIECASHADSLDATKRAGETYFGSRFHLRSARLADVHDLSADRAVVVRFDLTSVEVLDKKKLFVSGDAAHQNVARLVGLSWKSGAWVVTDMRPTS